MHDVMRESWAFGGLPSSDKYGYLIYSHGYMISSTDALPRTWNQTEGLGDFYSITILIGCVLYRDGKIVNLLL